MRWQDGCVIDRQAAMTVSFRLGSELDHLLAAGSWAGPVPALDPCDVSSDECRSRVYEVSSELGD